MNLNGIRFHIQKEDQIDKILEVSVSASSGLLNIADLRGLVFHNLTDNLVRFRGTHAKVQEALQKLQYTPVAQKYKLVDEVEIVCFWTNFGANPFQNMLRQNRLVKKMHIEYLDAPLYLHFPSKLLKANEDEVLRLANFSVSDPVFADNAEPPTVRANLTISAGTFGEVAWLGEHFGYHVSVVRSVAQLNLLLQQSPPVFRAASDFATSLCHHLIDVTFRLADTKNPARFVEDTVMVEVVEIPDPILLRLIEKNSDSVAKNLVGTANLVHGAHRRDDALLEVRQSLQLPKIQIQDVDHCCFSGAPFVNDESLVVIAHVPNVKMQVSPSPYVSQASCLWSTVDQSGAYPTNAGGFVTKVDFYYAQHARRPSYKVVKGLRGPSEYAWEAVDNILARSQTIAVGGVWAQKVRLEVKNYN